MGTTCTKLVPNSMLSTAAQITHTTTTKLHSMQITAKAWSLARQAVAIKVGEKLSYCTIKRQHTTPISGQALWPNVRL